MYVLLLGVVHKRRHIIRLFNKPWNPSLKIIYLGDLTRHWITYVNHHFPQLSPTTMFWQLYSLLRRHFCTARYIVNSRCIRKDFRKDCMPPTFVTHILSTMKIAEHMPHVDPRTFYERKKYHKEELLWCNFVCGNCRKRHKYHIASEKII